LVVVAPLLFHLITGADRGQLTVGGSAFVIAAYLLVGALGSTEQVLIDGKPQGPKPEVSVIRS
jgi:hypothetical protein